MSRSVFILMLAMCAAGAVTSCNYNHAKIAADTPVATPATAANNNARQASKSGRTYTRGIAGEGAEGARGASFITLVSSDGMNFTKWSTDYGTPERASSQLQLKLAKALEIVARESTKDVNGREVGETIVARFSANNRDAGPASLLWTAGSELFQADSSSVENILAYRKDFNH